MKIENASFENTYPIRLVNGQFQPDQWSMALEQAGYVIVPKRAWEIVVEARRDGWYEEDGGWQELDDLIRAGGKMSDTPQALRGAKTQEEFQRRVEDFYAYSIKPGERWRLCGDKLIVVHPDRPPIAIHEGGHTETIEPYPPPKTRGH